MQYRLGALALCVALSAGHVTDALAAGRQLRANAQVINLQGKPIGQVNFRSTPKGVLIEINLQNIAPGVHAVDIHASGRCDPKTGFGSSGGHFSSDPKRRHGYMTKGGAHAGDLPNQVAAKDGTMRATILTNQISLGNGKKSIFDKDNVAFVVHAKGDDYISQPAGNSGAAIACGIVKRVGPGPVARASKKPTKAAGHAVSKRQKT